MSPAGTLVSVIFVPPLLATSFHRVPPSSRAIHSFATLALCSACRVAWVMLGLLCVRGDHTETVHQVALHSICRRGAGCAHAASPTRLTRSPAGGAQDEGVPVRSSHGRTSMGAPKGVGAASARSGRRPIED